MIQIDPDAEDYSQRFRTSACGFGENAADLAVVQQHIVGPFDVNAHGAEFDGRRAGSFGTCSVAQI